MSSKLNPVEKDWDRFWARQESRRFSEISWSKRRILSVLDEYAKQGKAALDAGCGSGFFSQYFCERGMRTVSLDYADSALEMAREKTQGKARCVKADLLSDHLPKILDGKFDIIFSDGLLEHFTGHEQDAILKNFKSVLTVGGVTVTFVPNRFSPWELIRPLYMPGIEETPFILSDLCDLHQRNGLSVIRTGGVNALPFRWSPEWAAAQFGMLLYVVAQKSQESPEPS